MFHKQLALVTDNFAFSEEDVQHMLSTFDLNTYKQNAEHDLSQVVRSQRRPGYMCGLRFHEQQTVADDLHAHAHIVVQQSPPPRELYVVRWKTTPTTVMVPVQAAPEREKPARYLNFSMFAALHYVSSYSSRYITFAFSCSSPCWLRTKLHCMGLTRNS